MIEIDGEYIMVMHPATVERFLRQCSPQELWEWSYRQWRIAGRPDCTLREIVSKYQLPRGTVGEVMGMRIIE